MSVRPLLIHTCDILRADIDVVSGTIRGQKVADWETDSEDVECWFENLGEDQAQDGAFGNVGVARYRVWFEGDVDVLVNDRLVWGGSKYEVEALEDYSEESPFYHKVVSARRMPYAQP